MDGLPPPMAKDFFQIALKMGKYSNEEYVNRIRDAYDYIEKYWKLTSEDLSHESFDLEECFTQLESQIEKAYGKDPEEYGKLMRIEFRLKSFLAEVLSEFEHDVYQSDMGGFARVLLKEGATVLTFNYDCILESAIESASGFNPMRPKGLHELYVEGSKMPEEILGYSRSNWNRALCYGILFDEVQLPQIGVPKYAPGKDFYSHPRNKLYDWRILKLHGSLNWFKYLPISRITTMPGEVKPTLGEKEHEILLIQGHWWFNDPPYHNNWYIDPMIITPVLHKQKFLHVSPFKELWEMAKQALTECDKLVVIGYSFSPTDFLAKQLLREAFAENVVDELMVVNPHENIVKTVRNLCHFEGEIAWYTGLGEYVHRVPNPKP
jgi:hypothetical protein